MISFSDDDDVWGDEGRGDDDDVALESHGRFSGSQSGARDSTSESARAFQRVSRGAHQRAAIKATNERHCKSRPLY